MAVKLIIINITENRHESHLGGGANLGAHEMGAPLRAIFFAPELLGRGLAPPAGHEPGQLPIVLLFVAISLHIMAKWPLMINRYYNN